MKSHLVEHKNERVSVFNTGFGIYFNGADNNYPLLCESLIDQSPTATQCAWLYESFLGGGGFVADIPKYNLKPDSLFPYTVNNLLQDIAQSLKYHQGVYLHINYNALYKIDDISIVNYDFCRIGKKDDNDYNGKIIYSAKGFGRSLSRKDLDTIDVYNPNPDVIQAQVEKAGGWNDYKGQILFFALDTRNIYPKSLIETAYLFADTEFRMGLFYNSASRQGFNNAKIIRHKAFNTEEDKRKFFTDISALMGVENTASVMMVEDDFYEQKDGNFKIDEIATDIAADKFEHFETASANYIRKAFKNIPPQLVDYVQGKLGNTSGEDLIKAQAIYNALIARDRKQVEELLSILFSRYKEDINPNGDWTIKQYKIIDDGTVN